ncbi:MAG TPA: hypothetical protein VKR06_16440 [Ktedonosporobacter sp.]|nr:hypothetical protein [Ktedonosporobacter sp.]
MQIDDSLHICLRALESRYPIHVVDINEVVLGPQGFAAAGWTSPDIIAQLEQAAPALLQAQARLVVDPQKSEIYLLEHSEHEPALIIHCRGKLPDFQVITKDSAVGESDTVSLVDLQPIPSGLATQATCET